MNYSKVCTTYITVIHFSVNCFSILMYFCSRLIWNLCQGENSYFNDDFYVKVHISITHDGRSMPCCNLLIDLLWVEIMKSESNVCLQFDSYMFLYSVSAFLCNWWDLILRWNIYCESLVEFLHLHQPTIITFLSLVILENLTFFQRQELQKIYFLEIIFLEKKTLHTIFLSGWKLFFFHFNKSTAKSHKPFSIDLWIQDRIFHINKSTEKKPLYTIFLNGWKLFFFSQFNKSTAKSHQPFSQVS